MSNEEKTEVGADTLNGGGWKERFATNLKGERIRDLAESGIDPMSKDLTETFRMVTEEIKTRIAVGLTKWDKEDLLESIQGARDFISGLIPNTAGAAGFIKHKVAFENYLSEIEIIANAAVVSKD